MQRAVALLIVVFVSCGFWHGSGVNVSIVTTSAPSGVAPLAVHFDATATTSTETAFPFQNLLYIWNFGDGSAGSWTTGSNTSMNAAYGPVAGHVYHTAGTYTATLTVVGSTFTGTAIATVIVADPNTIFGGIWTGGTAGGTCQVGGTGGSPATSTGCTACFSTSGTFSASICSAAWQVTTSAYATVVADMNTGTKGIRALLRCGETFTTAIPGATITKAGAGVLDSYDSCGGTLPTVQATSTGVNSFLFNLSGTDWRLRNINIDPNGQTFKVSSAQSQFLYENLVCNGCGEGIHDDGAGNDLVFVVGCNFQNITQNGYMAFANQGSRLVLLGNTFLTASVTGAHIVRVQWGYKAVVSNNDMEGGQNGTFIIHGPDNSGIYTQYVVVSDNKIAPGSGATSPVSIDATSGSFIDLLEQIIAERNWIITNSNTVSALTFNTSLSVLRDNIYDMRANIGGQRAIFITQDGAGGTPTPSNNWIYNETVYGPNLTTGGAAAVDFGITAGQTTIANVLFDAQSASGTSATIVGIGSTPVTLSNNSCPPAGNSCQGNMTTDPQFTSVPAATTGTWPGATDYVPGGTSYALAHGANVPNFRDFQLNTFPQGGANNMGAIQ